MASEQLRRENKADHEREVQVAKDRVHKMASHFESLAEKVKSTEAHDHDSGNVKSVNVVVETGAPRGRGPQHGVEQTAHGVQGREVGRGEEWKGPSLEEIGQARGAAQENSMLAIRAAEERYQKAKNLGGSAGVNVEQSPRTAKKSVSQGAQTASQIAAEKAAKARDYTMEKSGQVKDVAAEKAMGLKNTAVNVSKKAVGYTGEKGAAAKEVTESGKSTAGYVGQAAQAVKDRAGQAAGYARERAAEAKDVTVETSKGTAGYVGQTAQAVKEKAGQAAGYAGEKAVTAKEVTVETGKSTAGYVGQVAENVKDKTMLAGWAAAEYTADKIVGATEAVANVTSGVAGYAGEKVVAGAGQKTMGYAGEKLAAVKDTVVATEESAKDYAARKKADKDRELEAKKSYQSKSEGGGVGATEENKRLSGATGKLSEQARGVFVGETREKYQPGEQVPGKENQGLSGAVTKDETGKEHEESGQVPQHQSKGQECGGGRRGVFGVIGETIAEIGQTTKDLIVGQGEGKAGGVQASCGGASQES